MCSLLIVSSCLLLAWATLVIGDCTYGASQLIEGSRSTKRGQFVDLDHPLPCSGLLGSHRFCFYTGDDTTENESYRVIFRIFRYDPEEDVLRQTHSLDRSFDLQQYTRSFVCQDHYYNENDTVHVLEGDYMAVYIPMYSEPLPVLGRDLPRMTVYEDSRSMSTQYFSTTVRQSDLELEVGTAIHVSAEIITLVGLHTSSSPILAGDSTSPFTFTPSPTPTTSTSRDVPAPVVEVTLRHDESHSRRSPAHTPTPTTSRDVPAQDTSVVGFSLRNNGTHSRRSPASVSLMMSSLAPGNKQDTSGAGFPFWVVATFSSGVLFLVLSAFIAIVAFCVCLKQRRKKHSVLNKNVPMKEISIIYATPQHIMSRDGNGGEHNPYDASIYESVSTMEVSDDQQCATVEFDATYSMLGPEADNSGQQAAADVPSSLYMHYEMEVFDIYSTPVSIENLSTRIRKVISTIKDTTPVPFHKPASEEEAIYSQLSYHNPGIRIPATEIRVSGHLGSGNFASVEKGVWVSSSGTKDVAIKTLHRDAGDANRVKCLQEAAIMAQFHHPNIVLLHGVVIYQDKTVSLVMEFLNGGDLSERLKNRYRGNGVDANTPLVLLNYSIQVTLGMLYLSEKGFVHRDLAARNVLISDKDICKIGDFGMSRELEDSIYYRSAGGIIPIKWTAPEAAFYRKYSTASDVWSYGCILYEIWSLGEKPFSNLFNNEVLEKVTEGFRLPPPPGCSHDIYKLMIDCWNPVPASRPMFKDILTLLISDEEELLAIPFEDASTDRDAFCLGAPLKAGHKMYSSLQTKYLGNSSTI